MRRSKSAEAALWIRPCARLEKMGDSRGAQTEVQLDTAPPRVVGSRPRTGCGRSGDVRSYGPDVTTSTMPGDPSPTARDRYRELVTWAVRVMDGRFTPYAAGQRVVEWVEDDPQLMTEAHGEPGYEELLGIIWDLPFSEAASPQGQETMRRCLRRLMSQLQAERT